jgi:predicted neutral ceramidase superfamily lipid hydrolase
MILLWSYPEVTMFLASIIIFVLLKKFSAESEVNHEIYLATVQLQAISVESGDTTTQTGADTHVLKHVARVLSVIALCVTGSLQPSVISLVYFIVFLGAATWYACNKELERAYAIVLRITLIFLMVHITALLAYQTPWPQDFFPVNTTIPRWEQPDVRFWAKCYLVCSSFTDFWASRRWLCQDVTCRLEIPPEMTLG